MSSNWVIVGAGLAGAKTAEALRGRDAGATIVLIGDEDALPYERPPLSKGYLKGQSSLTEAQVHDDQWYVDNAIQLRTGLRVTELDPAAHQVTLANGEVLSYHSLVLATGSSARTLPLPGADADGVLYLRRADDAERIKTTLEHISHLVVIGAGWIGLEVTAAAREAGVDVTVVESDSLPLLRVLGSEVAQVFADLHTEHGVDFRFHTGVREIAVDHGAATGVTLTDGTSIRADAVLIAVGAAPNVELAVAAGLAVDNGVLVGADLRTSDPDVYAVGDLANVDHPVLGRRVRVEHWANALSQPPVVAAGIAGADAVFDELPYFFTDQYDLGMEYVGYVQPDDYDQVVFRGDVAGREFIAFWLREGRVLAGMNVNVWDVVDPIKALILSGDRVDVGRLADPDVPLSDVAAAG